MKQSKRLRLRGVAWTLLGLAFLLLMLLALIGWNWFTSILCVICFLAFAGANMKAQRFFGAADFIAGIEAAKDAMQPLQKSVQAGEEIKKGDPVYLDKDGKVRKS